jgi:hypothetical protein
MPPWKRKRCWCVGRVYKLSIPDFYGAVEFSGGGLVPQTGIFLAIKVCVQLGDRSYNLKISYLPLYLYTTIPLHNKSQMLIYVFMVCKS